MWIQPYHMSECPDVDAYNNRVSKGRDLTQNALSCFSDYPSYEKVLKGGNHGGFTDWLRCSQTDTANSSK